MNLAMPNPTGSVFELTDALRAEGLAQSRRSPRRRMLLPIHRAGEDLVQRMINFMQPGTYIQAHQHPRDWATETIMVMSGSLGFVTFDEKGKVLTVSRLGVGDLIDIEARVWHGVLALSPDTVILEIKRGPYDDTDKVFAEWAPAENALEAPAYLSWLLSLFPEA
jgi:cupin fold WbuC family metalloprotein